jgi:glycosyltransferase involved in cell wall biosynthesis
VKILIVSQYFWPEEFRINDLAVDLVERGHEVTVITGNPNYPKGKFNKGYGYKFLSETYKGIKIYRVPIIPRGDSSGVKLLVNYVSFVISGSLFACFHKKIYDKIFAVNYSPITAVYPAIVYKRFRKIPLFIWVQDIWPESITAAGKIKNGFVLNLLNKMVSNIYKNSDKILVQSEAFIISVKEKGVAMGKLDYMPNWAEDLYSDPSVRQKGRFNELIPTGFIIMFAGNIGEGQDFESIIKAAEITKEYPDIKWVIIGDGRKKVWTESEINRLGLQDSVYLLGRYPMEDMPSFFLYADIMLVSLKDEKIFSMTIPGKIQSYMAFGKPIACMLNGVGADVIRKANCGYISNAGDYKALAKNVIDAYNQDPNFLLEKGKNGKKYYDDNFSKEVIIDNLIKIFQD